MAKPFIKIMLRVVIIILIITLIVFSVFSVLMARTLSFPNGLSLEEEKEWEQAHGVWSNLELYNTEEYTVRGMNDYILHCEIVRSDKTANSNKYVIISHGYQSNRYGAAKYVPIYLELGYSCIIYDLRGHGENEKAVCTIGNYEAQDLLKIIDDTYTRCGKDIYLGLHGESMGSSTTLSALGYKPDVKFAVADCGFTNLYELIGTGFKRSHIGFAEPAVDMTMKLLYGWSMRDTHAIDALADNDVPVCFIHGSSDSFITPDNSVKLRAATKGYSELHMVENAGHAESRAVLGKDAYKEIIEAFLNNCK